MAEALLEIVIGNLHAFVQNEFATFWGVVSQIQELSGNLTAIHAVLQDAEEKQITEQAVKLWLQKLSDAAHVLDDILEECSIESNRQQSGECLAPFCPMTILFRRDMGNRMKEMVDRFRRIDEERRRFQLRAGVMERQQEDDEWRQTSSVITETHMYGRDQDREKIVEFLSRHASSSDDLSIYPIVGMGGLGKTTLARWVFNDGRVIKRFDLRIWVCVSTHFNMMGILQSIVESTTGQNPNLLTLEAMQNKVQEALLGKRYLLVLDDLWNEDREKWEKLKNVLQCRGGTKGASVLVTTRNESVSSIVGTCPTHHLLPLSEDDNWSLFKYHAFGPNEVERAELVAIGKEIVKKCAGSPLASKALGSLLRNKKEEKQWFNVEESKFWDILEDDAITRALKISYFNLKLSLRQCFSFCAIFPEDFRIQKEELIHLWMANGFIKSKGKLEIEDVANEAWEELCQRSFFQEIEIDELGDTSFKMHDLFLELAQSIMGEECRVSAPAGLTNLSSRVHHIYCLDSHKELNMDPFKKVESLRTLINLDPAPAGRNFRELPPFNSLRALRTGYSQLSALKSLAHLRYLNLFRSDITTLPKCVSTLQKLQILKLEECHHLSCLPKHLTQLKDLRHLLIEECLSLVVMPPNIGELKCLKTLNLFIVDSKAGFGLAELRDLQLGGKLRIKGLENVLNECDARDANLIGKKDLKTLYLSWDDNSNSKCTNAEEILEALQPQSNLKSFGIKGYRGAQFPSWMRNTSIPSGLVMVILYDCKNCKHLPPLGKLPHLTVLYVSGMKDVKHIDDDLYDGVEEKAFKSLKDLTLSGLPNLDRILRDERVEMLPLLSTLKVSCVPKIKLPLLPSLEYLDIEGLKSDSDYDGNEDLASFPEAIVQNMHHVKTLRIEDFPKLKVLPHELGSLNSLRKLEFYDCDELESFSEDMLQGLSSLRTLSIGSCKKLKSLSEGVGHLTCLEHLQIMYCPELVTLPGNMSQLTALRSVRIVLGDRNRRLPEGLQRIPLLQELTILDVDSLPGWLGDMTSLQKLEIISFPELSSLPSSFRHLTNLRELSIYGCHKQLEKRCKRVTGEDWQNIAHIPQFKLVPMHEETFCDKIRSKWSVWKLRRNQRRYAARADEYEYLVERLFHWYKMSDEP